MSNEQSLEPGLTLGRLVAAERNANAAIEMLKKIFEDYKDYEARFTRLEAQIAQLQIKNSQLETSLVRFRGTGPTST